VVPAYRTSAGRAYRVRRGHLTLPRPTVQLDGDSRVPADRTEQPGDRLFIQSCLLCDVEVSEARPRAPISNLVQELFQLACRF